MTTSSSSEEPKTKVQKLIKSTLEFGGMSSDQSKQAAQILSRYLRLK